MSTMNQVIENIRSADRSGPELLTEHEVQLMSRIREKYLEYGFIGCTGCRYCVPCAQGVAISEILAMYNKYFGTRNRPAQQHSIVGTYKRRYPWRIGRCTVSSVESVKTNVPNNYPSADY